MRKPLIFAALLLAATPAVACNPAAAGASALFNAATFGLFCRSDSAPKKPDAPKDPFVRSRPARIAREETK